MKSIPEFGANTDYPYYENGVTEVPRGIKPPLDGYTNMEMAAIAGHAAIQYLIENGIDETLAEETANAVVIAVNAWFEKDLTEWRLAGLVERGQSPDEPSRIGKINACVDQNQKETGLAALAALKGSPLLSRGKTFLVPFARAVGMSIATHIEGLRTCPDKRA